MPFRAGRILVVTFLTALLTPFPEYRFFSPSRSSNASCAPVDAPEGTAARPIAPPARITSTSTVGLPRESRISRARMLEIVFIVRFQVHKTRGEDRGMSDTCRVTSERSELATTLIHAKGFRNHEWTQIDTNFCGS